MERRGYDIYSSRNSSRRARLSARMDDMSYRLVRARPRRMSRPDIPLLLAIATLPMIFKHRLSICATVDNLIICKVSKNSLGHLTDRASLLQNSVIHKKHSQKNFYFVIDKWGVMCYYIDGENIPAPRGKINERGFFVMKEYEEVRNPYLSAACKPDTAIAAHVIVYCDCGTQVDIVRYYRSGRCRIFMSGTVDNPNDEMTIYSSLRRLPSSVARLLDLAALSLFPCISCTYDGSALHMVHYGTARFDHIAFGVLFRG